MNLRNAIDECCTHIESNKVTDRRKYCDKLSDYLENKDVITLLNSDNLISWKIVISSVQECLRKDACRIVEEKKAKGSVATVKYPSADLFIQVLKLATKEADDQINVPNLVGYIIGCMKESKMKSCYYVTFIHILYECILTNFRCRGRLNKDDWEGLYEFLKSLSEQHKDDLWIYKCFLSVVKWGPSSGLAPMILRQEFDFFTKLCQLVTQQSTKVLQEHVLDISIYFCKNTAKDNKVSCCKFGEDMCSNFINLYELNGREARTKELIVEFFLLQMTLHHPNGVYEDHPCAYAFNWNYWKKCLKMIYSILAKELHFYLKYYHKNSSFFLSNGDSLLISEDFLLLFIEVSRQLFIYPDVDVSISLDCTLPSQGSHKRQKLDITLKNYINSIQDTKSWLWINIIHKIIEIYPKLIEDDEYLALLQTLSAILIESNDYNVVNNIYICFSIMLDMQQSTNNSDEEVDKLWKTIGETTTRAFALNQHKEVTEVLLKKLIQRRIVDLDTILLTFTSGILNISIKSIDVLEAGLQIVNLGKTDIEKKEVLMNCILNSSNLKDYKYLLHKKTARFLVNLALKQWPSYDNQKVDEVNPHKYNDIVDIYFKTSFKKEILLPKLEDETTSKKIFNIDFDVAQMLTNFLENFINNVPETIEILFSIAVLLVNILNDLINYSIIDKNDIGNSPLLNFLEIIFKKDVIQKFDVFKNKDQRDAKKVEEYIDILDLMFTMDVDDFVIAKVKNLIPLDLLKKLTQISSELDYDDQHHSEWKFQLKKSIIKTLSSFCCSTGNILNKNQKDVLAVLSKPDYQCKLDDDYALLVTFLSSLKYTRPGVIPEPVLNNIRNSVQDICEARYLYSENVLEILDIMYDLLPHFAVSSDEDNRQTSADLLFPFYNTLSNYGPEVSLALLKCVGQLIKLDPEFRFARWSNTEVIKYIPNFLCNDYQEVRLKSVEILATFFQAGSKNKKIQNFHKQEEVFDKIFEKSCALFNVEGTVTHERRIDETLARTASVLHTFASIIINCNCWIEECLFAFIKLGHLRNIDSVDKILQIISSHLLKKPNANIIENYLEYILEKWINDGFSLDDFQYKLFGCENKMQLYKKYFDICTQFFIVCDKKNMLEVASQLNISEKDIIERSGPKIFTRVLCSDVENMNNDIFKKNQILDYFVHLIGLDDLKSILTKNLEHIMLGILDFLTDEIYILENFEETIIFYTKHLSIVQFRHCLNFIETLLCDEQKMVTYLTQKNLCKLEKILFNLKLNIYKVFTVDDKLKMLHKYTYFISMVVENMTVSSNWQIYFLRETLHSLTNLIDNHKNFPVLAEAVCRFYSKYLKSILPKFAETFGNFLTVVINSLKIFSSFSNTIHQICLEIMKFLIIENSCHLMTAIEKLDSFPQHSDFDDIRNVHQRIKYGNTQPSLEEEIKYFLQHEDLSTRQDSLIYLKNMLSTEKIQLKQLYDNLAEIRGFSEDCEESLLHRLVSALVKMSCSTNENVSFEATKCLGELGPANLRTLVLQSEKPISNLKYSPFELLSGHVVSLLTHYIVDPDIEVVKHAGEALSIVLNCKEGRKVGESNIDFGYGSIEKQFILPFFPPSKTSPSSNTVTDIEIFISKVNVDELWCPSTNTTHESWLVSLLCAILEPFSYRSYLAKLIPICQVKPKFCEYLLPLIINLLVSINNKHITEVLSTNISKFFNLHWQNTVPKFLNNECITLNKKSMKCMLEVVNFVRLQKSFSTSKARFVAELDLNYLHIAKAAEFCAAHFSALFYSEMWCQSKIEEFQNNTKSLCEQKLSMIDIIYEHESLEIGEALHNILRNAYKALGELDALSGCGISFLLKPQFRVEHYKEQGKWDQVTHFYANQLLQNPDQVTHDLMDSFKRSSLYQIPLLCSKIEEPQYECLWRLSQWNTGEKRRVSFDATSNIHDFEKYRFYSLKSLHESNSCLFDDAKRFQNLTIVDDLRQTSFESSQNLYPILAKLQSIVEMEDFTESCSTRNFLSLMNKWKLQDNLVKGNDFQHIEPVITQRIVMLTDYLKRHDLDELKFYLIDLTLNVATRAKEEGYFKEGLSLLENLKFLTNLDNNVQTRIQLLDAQLSWLVNNKLVATHILNTICKNDEICPKLRSVALKLSGQYKSETYSENRFVIISDYFLKSVSVVKGIERETEDNNAIMDTYHKLAQFADKEYQQISTYMKSDIFQRKIANMEKARKTASSIHKQKKKTLDENKAAHFHDKTSDIDESEINTTKHESDKFLQLALKYYLANIHHSDVNNIRIFRIMSIFLENKNNPCIVQTIESYINKIPSYKFIIMLPQLIPHITDANNDLFSQKVNEIVLKCAKDHPHHTLPLLLSLANANKDRGFNNQQTNTSQNDNRILTAIKILEKLKKDKDLSNLINKMLQMSIALIDLAYYTPTSTNDKETEFSIPRSQKIMNIHAFDDVLLPTYNLKVSSSCKYTNIVGIASFGNVYYPVGGINAPKRITCRGTDGKVRSQLVKGQDDLRQDAVMQQVFTIMNNLLSNNKETSDLFIRTYKIVPLSMRSGILEWVDNSMPIGKYLVGEEKSPGAHQKYRKLDKSPGSCRVTFKNCANQPQDSKLNVYKSICHDFKPVFHKFFEEYFPQATVWYERRRAYIHSVATTSICGYVLGIGDRHVSNILVDTTTAEVIHIDFGIAFEQGRVLHTPETVPFRLTRDIVDGMGVSGVDGIFRRSCEKTMKLLRQNSQTISTILEVLLYDPLYAWTVTSAEANKRQTEDENDYRNISNSPEEDTSVNITAERALLRLREKLQGTELGHPTSIEHQVGTLIQQAVDPANLCRLFHGWQPYL